MENEKWVNEQRKTARQMLSLYNAINTNKKFDKCIIEAKAVLGFIDSLLESDKVDTNCKTKFSSFG